MSNRFRHIITGLLGAQLLACGALVQAAVDYGEMRRDVEVMSRALQAAAGTSDHSDTGLARIEGSYLAGQGVLLRLYAHSMGPHGFHPMVHTMDFETFGENIGAFVEDIVSEVEISLEGLGASFAAMPSGDHPDDHKTVFDELEMDYEDDKLAVEMQGQSPELASQIRELRREQSAARKEYAAAQREYERRIEEYEEQMESGSGEAEAQTMYERAEATMVAARDRYREGRQAYAKKLETIRNEQQVERQRRIAALARDTLDNFCRYGTSLRSLPKDERITLVFEGMGATGSGKQDLIYVVRKQDFSACMTGDIESAELVERAESYSF